MNPDIQALIKKSKESLEVAHELHNGEHYDFAVGRAYYAMFYIAEAALLEKENIFSSHRSVHNGFYHEFIDSKILDKIYHQSFIRGFELRQAGDYGVFANVSKDQSEDMLKRADDFIQILSEKCFHHI